MNKQLILIESKYRQHRETIHNFVWRALQIASREGVLFIILFLAARLLGPFEFGIYSYVLAVILFLILFGNFGIGTATSRYVAEYNAIAKDKMKLILLNSGVLILALSFVVIVLVALIGKQIFKEYYTYVLFALPLVLLSPMSALYDGVYRGLKKFKPLALISLSTGTVSAIAAYFMINMYGLIGAILAQNLLYLLLLAGLFLGHRELYFKFDEGLMKTIGIYSLAIGVSSLAYFLYTRADIIILEYFGYVTEIGYYEIINQTFMILTSPTIILAQVIAPNIAAFNARKEYSVIFNKLKRFFLMIVPAGVLMAVLFYFLFPELLNIFLKEYYTTTMILAFTILIFLLPTKIWGVFLTQSFVVSTGYAHIVALTTLIGGVLNVIFDIVFINSYGFIGVFWVTLIVHSFSIFFVTVWFYKAISKRRTAGRVHGRC